MSTIDGPVTDGRPERSFPDRLIGPEVEVPRPRSTALPAAVDAFHRKALA